MMTCTICHHKRRKQIETALGASTPLRDIACQFTVGRMALARHKEHCITPILLEVQTERNAETAITVLGELDWLRTEGRALYLAACDATDYRAAAHALGELRQQTKLRAELTGELKRGINIHTSPEWQEAWALVFSELDAVNQEKALIRLEAERAKRRGA